MNATAAIVDEEKGLIHFTADNQSMSLNAIWAFPVIQTLRNAMGRLKDPRVGQISDGYHTFDELYEHRIELFMTLCRFCRVAHYKDGTEFVGRQVWKSKLHADGTMFDGWFVAGIGVRPGEQITYHLPMSYWDRLDVPYRDRAPEWDGHTPADVLTRLKLL